MTTLAGARNPLAGPKTPLTDCATLWPALRPSVWAVDCSGILLNPM